MICAFPAYAFKKLFMLGTSTGVNLWPTNGWSLHAVSATRVRTRALESHPIDYAKKGLSCPHFHFRVFPLTSSALGTLPWFVDLGFHSSCFPPRGSWTLKLLHVEVQNPRCEGQNPSYEGPISVWAVNRSPFRKNTAFQIELRAKLVGCGNRPAYFCVNFMRKQWVCTDLMGFVYVPGSNCQLQGTYHTPGLLKELCPRHPKNQSIVHSVHSVRESMTVHEPQETSASHKFSLHIMFT